MEGLRLRVSTVRITLSKSVIKKLARRAGIKRISQLVYEQARIMFFNFLRRIVKDAIVYSNCYRRKAITCSDIVMALRRQGRDVYGIDEN